MPALRAASRRIRRKNAAVTLFTTLATVAGIAVVVGLPFWVNKLASTGIFVLLIVATLWARTHALKGGHIVAMHGYAMVGALIAFPLMALSVHMTAPTLIIATILPAYAAICGRNYALGLGASYIVASIAVVLAPMAGMPIPKLFPTPPVAEIASAAIAITGIIVPLSLVFDRMRDAVRALEKSEHLLRDVQQAAHIGCYITSLETGVWECTPVMNQLFGITEDYPHTIEGWVQFMHPDFSQPMNDYLRRVIKDKKPFDTEYKIRRPSDGAERWMHGLGQIA